MNKQKSKRPYTIILGFNKTLNEKSNSICFAAGLLIERKNDWGYGLDYTLSSYTPSSLQGLSISEIESFEGTTIPEGIEKRFLYDGRGQDSKLFAISPNIFKSITLLMNKQAIKLLIQAGPSLIYKRDLQYRVQYNPGFGGTFSGGGSPATLDYSIKEKNKGIVLGAFSKIGLRYSFNRKFGMELSTLGNINTTKSIFGAQFGFVLGRLYE